MPVLVKWRFCLQTYNNYGFWFFPLNQFTFPCSFIFESLISLSTQKLQEILCGTGVDSCVQMIRDRLMSCSILFYLWNLKHFLNTLKRKFMINRCFRIKKMQLTVSWLWSCVWIKEITWSVRTNRHGQCLLKEKGLIEVWSVFQSCI